jgi:hypothetical protein
VQKLGGNQIFDLRSYDLTKGCSGFCTHCIITSSQTLVTRGCSMSPMENFPWKSSWKSRAWCDYYFLRSCAFMFSVSERVKKTSAAKKCYKCWAPNGFSIISNLAVKWVHRGEIEIHNIKIVSEDRKPVGFCPLCHWKRNYFKSVAQREIKNTYNFTNYQKIIKI